MRDSEQYEPVSWSKRASKNLHTRSVKLPRLRLFDFFDLLGESVFHKEWDGSERTLALSTEIGDDAEAKLPEQQKRVDYIYKELGLALRNRILSIEVDLLRQKPRTTAESDAKKGQIAARPHATGFHLCRRRSLRGFKFW